MKNALKLISILCLFLPFNAAKAQYKEYKNEYEGKYYKYETDDKYSPIGSAITSLFIPGLGQVLCNEPVRGLAFLGGFVGSLGLTFVGFSLASGEFNNTKAAQGISLNVLGLIGTVSLPYISAFDAYDVAKIKNLAYRDGKPMGFHLKIQPNLIYLQNKQYGATLAVCINF